MSAPPSQSLKPPNRPAQTHTGRLFQLDKTSLPRYPVALGETRLLSSGLKVLVKYAFFPTLSKFWLLGLLPKTRRLHFTARHFRPGIASPPSFSVLWGKQECRMERALARPAARGGHCATRDSERKPDRAAGVPPGNLSPNNLRNNRALPAAKPAGFG